MRVLKCSGGFEYETKASHSDYAENGDLTYRSEKRGSSFHMLMTAGRPTEASDAVNSAGLPPILSSIISRRYKMNVKREANWNFMPTFTKERILDSILRVYNRRGNNRRSW